MVKSLAFSILIIFLVVLRYRYLTHPSKDIVSKHIYVFGDVATQQNYTKECEKEIKSKMNFPLAHVTKAVLDNGFFSFDKSFSEAETVKILALLNDSASYAWGEVGTFISDRRIVFYDEHHQIIAYTELEQDNGKQTYSYPYLKRFKWGNLTTNAYNELNKMIAK